MSERRKNTRTEMIVAGLAAIAFLDRGIRGIITGQATNLAKGSSPVRYFSGELAAWMGIVYLASSLVFIGYIFRFNRWRKLIFAFLFLLWICVSAMTISAWSI